jgi:HAD superfamily hydrolase (TIGR01509 family)
MLRRQFGKPRQFDFFSYNTEFKMNILDLGQGMRLPGYIRALLWDMDGVLVDSLKLALEAVNTLLAQRFGSSVQVEADLIRALFAYHTAEFWRQILQDVAARYDLHDAPAAAADLQAAYDQARRDSVFALNPGIAAILTNARAAGLKLAVVSNNPTHEVEIALSRAGILEHFDIVVGNDVAQLAKKPAPDTYLHATALLQLKPSECAVIEDSLIGVQAGLATGAHTLAVATGGTSFAQLEQSGAHAVYQAFMPPGISFDFGDVRQKRIFTPNEFVTHMLEHIAWRMGLRLELDWYNNDWRALGQWFGAHLKKLPLQAREAATLGMIDDGSAEVLLDTRQAPGLHLESVPVLDLDWFLSLRCEQLSSGVPLLELMQGLAEGLALSMRVRVGNVEDPHHTWEGVFRAIGITLQRLYAPAYGDALLSEESIIAPPGAGDLHIRYKSAQVAEVFRGTAESHVRVRVDFSRPDLRAFHFEVAPTIDVAPLPQLLDLFATSAGFGLEVDFKATVLSSSHVVLEDTALVLGRALLEILILRMSQSGVNGAGSSLRTAEDFTHQAVRVGISVEGRKFWRFLNCQGSADNLKKDFILGHDVFGSLRSEDLDDFLDGLAGGLSASIMIHMLRIPAAEEGWPMLFHNLGHALREAFAYNPCRKGVPPGVKATLA